MTLTEAELDYPWEGVTFVAVDKENPEVIYVAKRCKDENGKLQTIILSTESAMEIFGPLDGVETCEKDTPTGQTEDVHIGKLGVSLQRKQPTGNNVLSKIMDITQLDWKVVRSLQIGLPF